MEREGIEDLTLLGNQNTKYSYDDPSINILEIFDNKHQDIDYLVKFNCLEFTSLCPKTGQPDFAKIYIEYIPSVKMVESKALKLYLFSYRNHGAFHEDCIANIMKDLNEIMQPKFIKVFGEFYVRGGISIYPTAYAGDINLYKELRILND